jgi:hypothetical protein
VEIGLYEGQTLAAWEHLSARWPEMLSSLILRSRPTLMEALYLRARTNVAAAAGMVLQSDKSAVRRREELLRRAAGDARRIAREALGWSDPFAHLIYAAVAAMRGDIQRALTSLSTAESHFARADMVLHETVTRRRRGQLIGGEVGSALVLEADGWLGGRQVKRPERLAELLAPGQW